ncbi:unnamed protein product, partial [Ectocarpus sp. 4 AP-2014]
SSLAHHQSVSRCSHAELSVRCTAVKIPYSSLCCHFFSALPSCIYIFNVSSHSASLACGTFCPFPLLFIDTDITLHASLSLPSFSPACVSAFTCVCISSIYIHLSPHHPGPLELSAISVRSSFRLGSNIPKLHWWFCLACSWKPDEPGSGRLNQSVARFKVQTALGGPAHHSSPSRAGTTYVCTIQRYTANTYFSFYHMMS